MHIVGFMNTVFLLLLFFFLIAFFSYFAEIHL